MAGAAASGGRPLPPGHPRPPRQAHLLAACRRGSRDAGAPHSPPPHGFGACRAPIRRPSAPAGAGGAPRSSPRRLPLPGPGRCPRGGHREGRSRSGGGLGACRTGRRGLAHGHGPRHERPGRPGSRQGACRPRSRQGRAQPPQRPLPTPAAHRPPPCRRGIRPPWAPLGRARGRVLRDALWLAAAVSPALPRPLARPRQAEGGTAAAGGGPVAPAPHPPSPRRSCRGANGWGPQAGAPRWGSPRRPPGPPRRGTRSPLGPPRRPPRRQCLGAQPPALCASRHLPEPPSAWAGAARGRLSAHPRPRQRDGAAGSAGASADGAAAPGGSSLGPPPHGGRRASGPRARRRASPGGGGAAREGHTPCGGGGIALAPAGRARWTHRRGPVDRRQPTSAASRGPCTAPPGLSPPPLCRPPRPRRSLGLGADGPDGCQRGHPPGLGARLASA